MEGLRLQRITGKRRHALAVNLVVGGSAAAQIVIVHARKIIVYETVRMQHFNSARHRHRR